MKVQGAKVMGQMSEEDTVGGDFLTFLTSFQAIQSSFHTELAEVLSVPVRLN